jgi:hypothetical protein
MQASQGVRQFMDYHAGKNDAHQGQTARTGRGGLVRGGAGQEHKKEQKKKREVNAKFDAKKAARRNRPISHESADTIL